jgi:hypothetical protein
MPIKTSTSWPATIACVLFASVCATGGGRQQSITTCLPLIENIFGKPVPAAIPLYEINRDYAIQIVVSKSCDVLQAKVQPKYVWEEDVPQWTEPPDTVSLMNDQYEEILSRIGLLKPLGSQTSEDSAAFYYVTNSKTDHWDQYEHAFVNRVMHCCPGNEPRSMFCFTVHFLHRVQGQVNELSPVRAGEPFQFPKVMIGDDWYLAPAGEFQRARVGSTAVFNVAGPLL